MAAILGAILGHHLMLQHDNARPHVARICTEFLEAVNIPVLEWPAYSPDMSPIEHVWEALDQHIQQRVPVPANIQHLCTANVDVWTNIPQATINNLINSMRRRCVALREASGGKKNCILNYLKYDLKAQSCSSKYFRWKCFCFFCSDAARLY